MFNATEMSRFMAESLGKMPGVYYQPSVAHAIQRFVEANKFGSYWPEWEYLTYHQPVPGKGRPFQADCLLQLKENGERQDCLIEIKIVREQPISPKDLLYDVVKLSRVDFGYTVPRLLVVAGEEANFEKCFLNSKIMFGHGKIPLVQRNFPLKIGATETIQLAQFHPKANDYLAEFSRKLRVSMPDKVAITLEADYTSSNNRFGIWSIHLISLSEMQFNDWPSVLPATRPLQ